MRPIPADTQPRAKPLPRRNDLARGGKFDPLFPGSSSLLQPGLPEERILSTRGRQGPRLTHAPPDPSPLSPQFSLPDRHATGTCDGG